VPGLDHLLSSLAASFSHPLAVLGPLLAYGPVPGVELIPYFLGLLAWVGLALAAILRWPLFALLRRFQKTPGAPPVELKREPMTTSAPESPGEKTNDMP
jgi:hypothetical protein